MTLFNFFTASLGDGKESVKKSILVRHSRESGNLGHIACNTNCNAIILKSANWKVQIEKCKLKIANWKVKIANWKVKIENCKLEILFFQFSFLNYFMGDGKG